MIDNPSAARFSQIWSAVNSLPLGACFVWADEIRCVVECARRGSGSVTESKPGWGHLVELYLYQIKFCLFCESESWALHCKYYLSKVLFSIFKSTCLTQTVCLKVYKASLKLRIWNFVNITLNVKLKQFSTTRYLTYNGHIDTRCLSLLSCPHYLTKDTSLITVDLLILYFVRRFVITDFYGIYEYITQSQMIW